MVANLTGRSEIERALTYVGEVLDAEGKAFAIVILGGAALNLLGLVARTTTDVDILAIGRPGDVSRPRQVSEPPNSLPASLSRAIRLVAEDMGLAPDWMNTGPALQWRTGLPPGLATRIEWRRFGNALDVGIVSRFDLIFFKLFAAADDIGTDGVHYQDLLALAPTSEELMVAATWVRGQDASPAFAGILQEVLTHVRRHFGFSDRPVGGTE
jgi:hypothetical protein